ncbi:MAG: AAA family ATPase, partial [Deltaproteobacteria bacterium]|nr:AAA family ATPase [Deltaproteobacteria bacterium]
MSLKGLPLGSQTFIEIIGQNLVYADKTKWIYDLLCSYKRSYFLSRPPRFGKTLLLQTLNEIFTGNRDIFKGLWISKSNYAFPKFQVLFLSLSMKSKNPDML